MKVEGIPIAFLRDIHIPDLEAFHDHLLDTASKIVTAGDEVAVPMIFVLSRDGRLAIIPPPGSKNAIATFQKALVLHPMTRACALVFEAWTSSPKDMQNYVEPRLDPERKEAIVVSILTAGRQAISTSPIERPSNIVQKAPFRWIDEAEAKYKGRFVR